MIFSKSELNVVIPVLNGAEGLGMLLEQLRGQTVLVVDGGSTDESCAVAREYAEHSPITLLRSEAGRGTQLAFGAGHTVSRWLLFLHADSRLAEGWQLVVADFIRGGARERDKRLGVFRFGLDDSRFRARCLERFVDWRGRWLGLPYGDQGMLINRDHYLTKGGFDRVALMEDVSFVRKFSRREIDFLPSTLTTSAARYRRDGYGFRVLRNGLFLLLYYCGVKPDRLARFY